VRPVHLEFFDDLQGIAEAKAELLEGLSSDGTVIANADDPEVVRIVDRHPGRKVWYGLQRDAEFGAEDVVELPTGGSRFVFRVGGDRYPTGLPLYGRYNVENFLAAAACAHTVGLEVAEILGAASKAEPGAMRGVVHRLLKGSYLVDDSYNSNPDALSQSLASARALEGRRHWAVLGSMLELGKASPDFHRRLGREAANLGFAPVLVVGAEARSLAEGVSEAGGSAIWFEDAAQAAAVACEEFELGDVVLIKGSRGIGLDLVADRLLRHLNDLHDLSKLSALSRGENE
jgi:UDP-N-acetylmuramyl pentapeptide synthase